jgi:hypothetical protein
MNDYLKFLSESDFRFQKCFKTVLKKAKKIIFLKSINECLFISSLSNHDYIIIKQLNV